MLEVSIAYLKFQEEFCPADIIVNDELLCSIIGKDFHSSGTMIVELPVRDLQWTVENLTTDQIERIRNLKGVIDFEITKQQEINNICYCICITALKEKFPIEFLEREIGHMKTCSRIIEARKSRPEFLEVHWYNLPENPLELIKRLEQKYPNHSEFRISGIV